MAVVVVLLGVKTIEAVSMERDGFIEARLWGFARGISSSVSDFVGRGDMAGGEHDNIVPVKEAIDDEERRPSRTRNFSPASQV